jgi:hypothetical protein
MKFKHCIDTSHIKNLFMFLVIFTSINFYLNVPRNWFIVIICIQIMFTCVTFLIIIPILIDCFCSILETIVNRTGHILFPTINNINKITYDAIDNIV